MMWFLCTVRVGIIKSPKSAEWIGQHRMTVRDNRPMQRARTLPASLPRAQQNALSRPNNRVVRTIITGYNGDISLRINVISHSLLRRERLFSHTGNTDGYFVSLRNLLLAWPHRVWCQLHRYPPGDSLWKRSAWILLLRRRLFHPEYIWYQRQYNHGSDPGI